jgi:hypothetical protein
VPQEGDASERLFGKGSATLVASATPNAGSLTLTLPDWADGQTERTVCISTNDGACGTFAKICNGRTLCRVGLSGPGSCGAGGGTCASPLASLKTTPLATATHAVVVEFEDAEAPCVRGSRTLFNNVARALARDVRAQITRDLGAAQASALTDVSFSPQFCSPVGKDDGTLATGRYGLVGFGTVTGPPQLIDDALSALALDAVSTPGAVRAMCTGNPRARGGSNCRKYGIAVAAALPAPAALASAAPASNEVTTSTLFNALRVYFGTGFNILQYNPAGSYTGRATVTSIDPFNWLTRKRVYDPDSIAAVCAKDECFSNSAICSSSISSKTSTSSAERQYGLSVSVSAGATYAGVTGSLNTNFQSSQSELAKSSSISVSTSGECGLRKFVLPSSGIKLSTEFLTDVGAALDAIIASEKQGNDDAKRERLTLALDTIYRNYGTHIPLALSFGAWFRAEVLLNTTSLLTTYKTQAAINTAMQYAVADVAFSVGKNSNETNTLFNSTTASGFVTVPASATVPAKPGPNGVGYKIDPIEWTRNLLTKVAANSLYPNPLTSKPLHELFADASLPKSSAAKLFGALTQEQMGWMRALSKAFHAYVTNEPSLWPGDQLPVMPQLLNPPNYLGKDGKCVDSDLIVRVNQKTNYGASFKCLTCVRDTPSLPSDFEWSKHNPEYTAKCTIGQDGSLASIKGECKPCDACTLSNNDLCLSRGGGYTGLFSKPATCDGCQECNVRDDCGDSNGYGRPDWKQAVRGKARCFNGRCVQCTEFDGQCESSRSSAVNYGCCKLSIKECRGDLASC